ncbi:arsenic resistance protein [Rhizobiaceae bacterium BDR2-2]|uniref:Arsenic resistance protein n=1 Tax=Ectorhizobium quercum TaxID=2965071 RepID=A0AAE3SWR8_9HYPH|nr:arsenic resistance protein [Ectorhizobium quercum]MCX8999695.1 arsenic resistance protein [Ectorhizobium quercum]
MTRDNLERNQVWVYLAAILLGLATGSAVPGLAPVFELLLWPGLALLLYATFTQVRLDQLPAAFRDGSFIFAALIGNFVVLPVLVWGVLMLVPDDPAIRLGLLLVLLVPCTDWFITFAHQAGGDLRRAIAITPALLVVQMLLLPVYLWLFMGEGFAEIVSAGRMVTVFAVVIVLPLALAWLTERWAGERPARAALVERIGWFPVPLLAVVLFLIAASQVEAVAESLPVMGKIFIACVAFLIGGVICGLLIGKAFKLPVPQARTLVFTLTTRNSFVVLPFALALPATWEMAAIVIVFQSLIELFGMLALLWLVPRKLLPASRSNVSGTPGLSP